MRKLIVFNHISLDGYFTDSKGDMSFANNATPDPEWDAFVKSNAGNGGTLVFGRITYQLMASFWPTPAAAESMPVVAERMNSLQKIVFSRTLKDVSWKNTRLVKDNMPEEIRKMKQEDGADMVIFGSGNVISQLAQANLIDEYQMIVDPVVLGDGRTLFEGMKEKVSLKRTQSRTFDNGNVLLYYVPSV